MACARWSPAGSGTSARRLRGASRSRRTCGASGGWPVRGAELLAQCLIPALGRLDAAALAPYDRARRREFRGKWLLERLIGVGVGWPALTDRVVRRLAARPDLADLLVSATGNIVPARRVLRASVLAQFLW